MKITTISGHRSAASVVALALMALVLPFAQPALAANSPTMTVTATHASVPGGDHFFVNRGDQVVLTATLSTPAPHQVNIDWENEGGPNDPLNENDPTADDDRTAPDDTCTIAPGALSCSIDYVAEFPGYDRTIENPSPSGAAGGDQWRAWVDQDHNVPPPILGSDATDDADGSEDVDEEPPGNQPANATAEPCTASGATEPDCTDVVVVNIGALEVAPDVQTVDSGSTAILVARMFAPVQQAAGLNIDWEAENHGSPSRPSGSDPDPTPGTSRGTPDFSCDIPQGGRTCTNTFTVAGGSDQWRAWIDSDRVQTSDNSDTSEGRYAGPTDCDQPEDPTTGCRVTDIFGDAASPGDGCGFSGIPGDEDPSEPDCTDVVSVSSRPGTIARIDCDDQGGNQGQDTERETNPESSEDPLTGEDPSIEEYRCEAFNAAGGRMNNVQIKAEVENGVNDPESPDGATYTSPDYQCTTASDPRAPITTLSPQSGVCYIDVTQADGELGTAEICFWTGTGAEGQTLCGDEPTGEAQVANGTDPANDLADQVEKTWADESTFLLDCDPETDSNPAGQQHAVTCTVTSPDGSTISGVRVDTEVSGAGDPDATNPNFAPDRNCTTGSDGRCTFTHASTTQGNTEYRSWIQDPDTQSDPSVEGSEDADPDEGRNEQTVPGDKAEPDNTDVTQKTWTPPGTNLTMTPETDSARVGECNPYTITLTDSNGAPVPNAVIDVEQRHALADNQVANDEPTVSFCEPSEAGGPNPSNVDESRGDLGSGEGQENPDNPGTSGGETVKQTDQNGKITIGIKVAPGNGSNGSGGVSITAWWETTDNDDPDTNEPKDTSNKSWTPSAGEPGVPAGVSLDPTSSRNELREEVTYTATVSDANGDPVEGATVTWTEDGPGTFIAQETTTDASGQASASVTSEEPGTQTITATAEPCAEGATCSDTATQTWGEQQDRTCRGFANDPRNQIVGTPGNDTLRGTGGDDIICGLGGNDTLIGRGGDDLLIGNRGDDILRGNAGDDILRGGGGEDTLTGGGGKDTIRGNGGADILKGGGGKDTLKGNRGKDILRGRGGNDRLLGNKGRDTLNGGKGNDLLNGGPGVDSCQPGPGRDRLRNCE